MRQFTVISIAVLAVFATTTTLPVQGQACDDDLWTGGGPASNWDSDPNWQFVVPQATDIAVFSIPSDTLMDLAGQISWPRGQPWKICSWVIEYDGASEVAFGAFDANDAQFATALSTLGDLSVSPLDYSNLLNDYTINVGQLDGVLVGDGLNGHTPVLDAETFGIKWNLLGTETGNDKAWVGVTGKIGGGQWTASRAAIGVGIELLQGDFIFTNWYPNADGTIDSAYPTSSPGDNDWTLDMVNLYAKRCQNLDDWTINHSMTSGRHGHSNYIYIRDFFEANTLTFNAALNDGSQDEFHAYMVEDADITTDGGLHIDDFATFRSRDDNTIGPQVYVENLRVRENATLTIENATLMAVTGPETANAEGAARFLDGASLRYGGNGPDNFLLSLKLDRLGPNFPRSPENLLFYPDAYIRPVGNPPYVPANDYDLDLVPFDTSFEIKSVVSKAPAIDWYTGDVDLIMRGAFDESHTLEVISEDGCNLWFEDVPEPRCQKFWRSFEVWSDQRDRNYDLTLVDDYDNHACGYRPAHPARWTGRCMCLGTSVS